MPGVRLLTLPATHGGPRPFAQLTCHPVPRLWAPTLGVQAWGSAPLTAQAPKCPANLGAPWGRRDQSVGTQEAGGRRGNWRNLESRTPEREGRTPTERGVSRGSSPWTRSLGTFSGARESTPPVGAGPDKPKGLPAPAGKEAPSSERGASRRPQAAEKRKGK